MFSAHFIFCLHERILYKNYQKFLVLMVMKKNYKYQIKILCWREYYIFFIKDSRIKISWFLCCFAIFFFCEWKNHKVNKFSTKDNRWLVPWQQNFCGVERLRSRVKLDYRRLHAVNRLNENNKQEEDFKDFHFILIIITHVVKFHPKYI